MWKPKFSVGNKVYAFLSKGSMDEKTQILPNDLLYLAKIEVTHVLIHRNCYCVRIEKILFDFTFYINSGISLFPVGSSQVFNFLWIERGEEAFKIFDNPSVRLNSK